MFSIHLFYKEGTRPSMAYPFCEKENADRGASNGQCGSHLTKTLEEIGDVSCPYCVWEKMKDVYATTPGLPETFLQSEIVHWSIHPVFSVDGRIRFLRWDAACGEVKVHPDLCLGTRSKEEVTCQECKESFVNETG